MAKRKVNFREIFEDEDLALDNEAKRGIKSQVRFIKIDDEKLRTAHAKLCAVLGLKTPQNEMAKFEVFKAFAIEEKNKYDKKEQEKKEGLTEKEPAKNFSHSSEN